MVGCEQKGPPPPSWDAAAFWFHRYWYVSRQYPLSQIPTAIIYVAQVKRQGQWLRPRRMQWRVERMWNNEQDVTPAEFFFFLLFIFRSRWGIYIHSIRRSLYLLCWVSEGSKYSEEMLWSQRFAKKKKKKGGENSWCFNLWWQWAVFYDTTLGSDREYV